MKKKPDSEKIEINIITQDMLMALKELIIKDIDPFLSIPLENKMNISIDDYVDKIIKRADGYVAIIDGKIVGLIAAYIKNRYVEDRVFLSILGVKREYRNMGIGTLLLSSIIEELPREITLFTTVDVLNERAWKTYQKVGFVSTHIADGRRYIEYKT